MSIAKDAILAHFGTPHGGGPAQMWSDMVYALMRVILSKVDFENLEQLAEFCDDPNNLVPWVSGESDRVVFASRLAEGVREMIARVGSEACSGG